MRKKHVSKCLTYVLQWKNIHANEYTCTFNTSYKETKHSLLENVPDSFLASLGCPKEHHITSVFTRTSTRKAQYVVLRVYFVRPENVVKYDSIRLYARIFIFKYVPLFFHLTYSFHASSLRLQIPSLKSLELFRGIELAHQTAQQACQGFYFFRERRYSSYL